MNEMCGIIGYVGNRNGNEVAVIGLKRLEYRGYDSVGMGYIKDEKIMVKKDVGKVDEVVKKLKFLEDYSNIVVSHTRWGTHGKITKENAHPHLDCKNEIAIVHNGIIENYHEIKNLLEKKNHFFRSETDSEVVAHLIEEFMHDDSFENACKKAFSMLKGSFAILAIYSKEEKIVGIRKDSPLVVGIESGGSFAASDIYALLPFTNEFIFLQNYDFIVLERNCLKIENLKEGKVNRYLEKLEINLENENSTNYHYFMLKEIMEQSEVPDRILEKNVNKFEVFAREIKNKKRVFLVGAGSSFHACLYGSYLFSRLGIESRAIVASEFSYYKNLIDKNSLVLAISQSGETADVLEAINIARKRGARIFSIVNIYGSTLMRESDNYLLMNAGFEVGVAATKTFTAELMILLKLYKIMKNEEFEIREIKSKILDLLGRSRREFIEKIAEILKNKEHIFLIGRGLSYISALEGALKIKEISYIHAEAFPGGELKHGTLALIEDGTPSIILIDEESKSKILSNASEIKARGGFTIGISSEDHKEIDIWIKIPTTKEETPILQIIPLQILAYLLATKKGYNPDYPRNLAKSVTVK
ncbi:MAG: glutamine--fructose-6-phosphate transaminase (isomerizing) [Candidatus Aenigmatarchaeota archaeon]